MATINPIVEVVVNVLTSDVGKDTELESKALTPGSPNYIWIRTNVFQFIKILKKILG